MRVLLAIAMQTIRSAVRSRVFHVLFALTLLAVVLLPVTVSGDGTATGQLQVALTYSLGVVTVLISTATLWLSCAVLAREIEQYNLHLVLTKPAPPWQVWLGKWLGVVAMHLFILVVAAAAILALIHWRLQRGEFAQEDLDRLRHEVMVGRREFHPDQIDFAGAARAEYQRRMREGTLAQPHEESVILSELLRQVKAKSTEVPAGAGRLWVFRNVRVRHADEPVYLRFRHYIGSTTQSDQRLTEGLWGVRVPTPGDTARFAMLPRQSMSGNFYELVMPGSLVPEDGVVLITYENRDPAGMPIIFQVADGPVLLVRRTGFAANYARAMLLAAFQIAFLAALGGVVGAAFSTPVAVFVAVSYLVVGMALGGAVNVPLTDPLGDYQYSNVTQRLTHYLALGLDAVVVSVDDFDASSALAKGQLIEFSRLLASGLGLVVLRGGILAALGMLVLSRRELGTVVRR